MSNTPHQLPILAEYSAQNSYRSRGHVVVIPGRGESAGLYERLGARLAYDGYTVTIVGVPSLDRIDAAWLDGTTFPDAFEAGRVTLVGSDSGAVLATLLADRLGATALVLAGLGGFELVTVFEDDEARVASRSACRVYGGRLTSGDADLSAPGRQRFGSEVGARFQAARVSVPLLAIHGVADPLSPLAAAAEQYRALSEDVRLVTVDGGLHDILNDLSHRSVSAEIVQFLENPKETIIDRRMLTADRSAA